MNRPIRSLLLYGICVVFAVSVLMSSRSYSQNGAPKYDATTETKMKGTVEELKLPEKGHDKEIVHLVMNNGGETVDIYLCPKSFMDDMGVTFTKGDEIAFTGSKVKQGGADMVLAREVVKGQDTLTLRDDKGKPVWVLGR
jgi:hypothetical protein